MSVLSRQGLLAFSMSVFLAALPALADVPILPLDQVEVGMKAKGRTVFSGADIESFDCTVIGILEGFDFEMDMILIRIDSGPVVTRNYGIIAGMSGSPIYVDGRMIGALAYGWAFQNEPIAGVTPIEQMLQQYAPGSPEGRAARARREVREAGRQQALLPPPAAEGALRPRGSLALDGRPIEQVLIASNRAEAQVAERRQPGAAVLCPVATPLFCRGVSASAMPLLEKLFEPYNLLPMQAGGGRVPAGVKIAFEPGAAIAVPFASGDIELTAVGTLTYVDGDVALGFGHPFMGLGAVDMPMATGYIHGVIASSMSSSKLGSAVETIGRISQDRPTCIGGEIGGRADLLKLRYTLTEKRRGAARDFRVNLVRQAGMSEMYTVVLMQMAMQNVAGAMFDGVTNSRVNIVTRVERDGQRLRVERNNSFDSKAVSAMGMNPLWDLFMTLSLLRQNPWGEAEVETVDIDLEFESARRFANIERANASRRVVRPGERFDVALHLKPYGGDTRVLTIPVTVPETAPLGPLAVVLIGGNDAFMLRPQINPPPIPKDVPSLIGYLNNTVANNSVLIECVLPSQGVEFGGRMLHDLPEPYFEPLFTSSADGTRLIPDVRESVMPTADVVAGAAAVVVEVVGEDGPTEGGSGASRTGLGQSLGGQTNQITQPGMEFFNAAAEELRALTVGRRLGGRSFELAPPGPASVSTEQFHGLLDRAYAAHRRFVEQSRRRIARPPAKSAPPPARRAAAPAVDTPPAEDAPPDVTGSLKLDEPPRMPGWKELDELAKGQLLAEDDQPVDEEEPAGEETEVDEEEGEPLARAPKIWKLGAAEEFLEGRFDRTYASTAGQIGLAPRVAELGLPETDRVWALLARRDGSVMVGSWAERAGLYKLTAGEPELWYEADDSALTALVELPDGSVLAGGVPSGRIYRVTGPRQATVWVDLDEDYIWALEPDGEGGVYAATGNAGRLYRIAADGTAKVVLQSDQRHLLALCPDPAGGVYAGTYPEGKVYRIDGDRVESIYQLPQGAVLSLTATPNGNLYIGGSGEGTLYRLRPDGDTLALLEDEGDSIYSLCHLGDVVYATTAWPGRLYRVDDQDVSSLIYRTDEPFLLEIKPRGEASLAATVAGSGQVLELTVDGADRGYYLSPILDAETLTNWGVMRWQATVAEGGSLYFQTRSGNTARPDRAWSPWSEGLVVAEGTKITSPPARYLQFRAVLDGGPGVEVALRQVEVFYRTVNRPPTVKLTAPELGAVVRKTASIEWEASDPDEDELHYEVYYAPQGSDEWTRISGVMESTEGGDEGTDQTAEDGGEEAVATEAAADDEPDDVPAGEETAPADKPEKLTETTLEWDTTGVPDGRYRLKIVAHDRVANPDDPRTVERISWVITVDNTGPTLVGPEPGDLLPPEELQFVEATTYLASAEYQLDDGEWTALLPVDGIFDEPRETILRPALPEEAGEHTLTIRVRDAAGNVSRFRWTFTIGEG